MEVHALKHVDDGRHQLLGQGEGRVMLRIAADLQHALAELGEGDREVRRGCRFSNPALAIFNVGSRWT
jgi:hypothetical protein